jgi:hypothetical protein
LGSDVSIILLGTRPLVQRAAALVRDEEDTCSYSFGVQGTIKYIFQCSGFSVGGGCWVSIHSKTKSAMT